MNSRRLYPMVENCEIKSALYGFDLFPGNLHKHRVDVGASDARQNLVGLCCRSGCNKNDGIREGMLHEKKKRLAAESTSLWHDAGRQMITGCDSSRVDLDSWVSRRRG